MLVARLTAPHRVELLEQDMPVPGPGQVRLRVEQCGVCASEVDLWLGRDPEKLPANIGHEVAGTVEELTSPVRGVLVGDRVVTLVNDGGGFAQSIVVEASNCVVVNPSVTFPAAAEPLACAVATVELVGPRLGDDVVIVGSGFMGCLVQLLSALKGPRSITVADIRPDALSRAKALGATRVVDVSTEDLGKVVRELTDGRGADVVYEVTGSDGGLSLSGEVAKMGGKLCIVAYHQGGSRSVPLGKWNWMALQIFNAHFRDRALMFGALREGTRLVNAGLVDVSGFLTDIYPLEDIAEAFEKAAAKPVGFLKAAVAP